MRSVVRHNGNLTQTAEHGKRYPRSFERNTAMATLDATVAGPSEHAALSLRATVYGVLPLRLALDGLAGFAWLKRAVKK